MAVLASLHEFVPFFSFTPGPFFGYVTICSVYAAAIASWVSALLGEMCAVVVSILFGAVMGLAPR